MEGAARTGGRLARVLLGRDRQAARPGALCASFLELERFGPAPLASGAPAVSGAQGRLQIAAIVPSFRRGSGGHATIVALMRALRALGHEVSLWLEDCDGRHADESSTLIRKSFAEFFATDELTLHTDMRAWCGADVVVATGWQTVARALLLDGVRARAYLVQDHEPDFYGASAEALLAEDTYRRGLHCIAASSWLARLLRERYRASATHFDLAVDHRVYHPSDRLPGERDAGGIPPHGEGCGRENLVVFYARAVTPRRAVTLGLLALAELSRRRPDVQIALFGEDRPLSVPFAHANLGVLPAAELARLYARARVGMVLSLTNPSLIGLEMMACGLSCVELAGESMLESFGGDGPLALTRPRPVELCEAIERLLDSPAERRTRAQAGVALMAGRTWERAALQVQCCLRTALAGGARVSGEQPHGEPPQV